MGDDTFAGHADGPGSQRKMGVTNVTLFLCQSSLGWSLTNSGINLLPEVKTGTMSGFLSTGGGKTLLAGIIFIITGALAKAYECPYDNAILIVGVAIAVIGAILYFSGSRTTDTGS